MQNIFAFRLVLDLTNAVINKLTLLNMVALNIHQNTQQIFQGAKTEFFK